MHTQGRTQACWHAFGFLAQLHLHSTLFFPFACSHALSVDSGFYLACIAHSNVLLAVEKRGPFERKEKREGGRGKGGRGEKERRKDLGEVEKDEVV